MWGSCWSGYKTSRVGYDVGEDGQQHNVQDEKCSLISKHKLSFSKTGHNNSVGRQLKMYLFSSNFTTILSRQLRHLVVAAQRDSIYGHAWQQQPDWAASAVILHITWEERPNNYWTWERLHSYQFYFIFLMHNYCMSFCPAAVTSAKNEHFCCKTNTSMSEDWSLTQTLLRVHATFVWLQQMFQFRVILDENLHVFFQFCFSNKPQPREVLSVCCSC